MSLDIKQLVSALQNAKSCKPVEAVPYRGEINEYLFEHYLTPFLFGNTPTVGDLDFSRFTVEDVQEFGNYLEYASRASARLIGFCNVFAQAKPVARTGRVFC